MNRVTLDDFRKSSEIILVGSSTNNFLYHMVPIVTMAQKEKDHQIAVRLTSVEYDRIMGMIDAGLYRSSADFAREAIRDKIRSLEVVSVKDVSLQEAKRMILSYLKKNPGSHFASEMADELGIEYGIAFKAVNQLLESGKMKKGKGQ